MDVKQRAKALLEEYGVESGKRSSQKAKGPRKTARSSTQTPARPRQRPNSARPAREHDAPKSSRKKPPQTSPDAEFVKAIEQASATAREAGIVSLAAKLSMLAAGLKALKAAAPDVAVQLQTLSGNFKRLIGESSKGSRLRSRYERALEILSGIKAPKRSAARKAGRR